ncbi:MAG: Stp1/IreP family PP2C-type Ser/Thr phosphatase [Lachnospiraceae bacterium]|nr:Stp1/IreP family PP2C-type Ser/Thr phosphatase [Lachnospiraceae bacterium]
MLLETYSATDIGRKRQLNQDYVFSSVKPLGNMPNLFIVADGMGGHNAGDYASKCTTETVVNEIQNSFEKNPTIIIKKAIKTANAKIRKEASENENLFGMGTTLVIATIIGKYLQVSNIGDSRLYLLNKDGLRQVTEDHSLVEEMIRLGGLSREDARLHPDKNIITRAIGAKDEVEADFFTEELETGDIVLICSDGLTNMLEDKEIEAILLNPEKEELIQKGDALIKAANENGGKDNIAVVLVRLVEDDEVKE